MARGFPAGYGLVVTSERITGTKKTPWKTGLVIFLGEGSSVTQPDRGRATEVAMELIRTKEFELTKDKISRISYKKPGLFARGHLILKSADSEAEIKLARYGNDATSLGVNRVIISSLLVFAPDRLYNESTGDMVRSLRETS